MYTDSQLARDVASHYDLEHDRHDEEGARQDWHAARVEQVRGPLERRMVRRPTAEELGQAMAAVLVDDLFPVARAFGTNLFESVMHRVLVAELRKMADTAAEAQVQREERESEGEARKSRRVVLGDEVPR